MDSSSAPNPPPEAGEGGGKQGRYAVRTERERALEAILRAVARDGYEAVTPSDVTAAAEISRQRFDALFESKEACFLEAYDAAVDVLLAYAGAAYEAAASRPWPERIVAGLRSILELLAAEAEIAGMTVLEVGAVGEDARVRHREALMRFAPFLDEGRETSEQARQLPPDTARFAIGAAASMIFDEVRAGRITELPRILPELSFAMLMPYLGAEAAEAEMGRIAK